MIDVEQKIGKRVEDLTTALSEESMRGKILILTAQIDDLLSEMLKRVLKGARRKDEDVHFLGPW